MPQIIKFTFITLLCFSFWNIDALQNKKQEKKKKSAPTKKLYDCKNYHQGKFIDTSEDGRIFTIHRESEIQYIYRNYPNDYLKQSIEWINDCKYKVTVIEIHDPIVEDNSLGNISIITIGNRNKDFYEYTESFNGKVAKSKMLLIKD